jgi:lipid-A-disaccharide synthase
MIIDRSKRYKICLSAGERSGDQHAANLFIELKKQLPFLEGIGMGSSAMAQVGIELHYDSNKIAVIGVIEVIKHYIEIRRALKKMQNLLLNERPDLLICVDYKEFNYQLASFAKKNGIKVLFYVSPQVWAWRANRVTKYGAAIDMMAVIFPFETAYYKAQNIPVRYVGHPSVDKVNPKLTKAQAQQSFCLEANAPTVGLVAGSRINEIKRLLPTMLEAAKLLREQIPDCQFVLPQAESIPDSLLMAYLLNYDDLNVRVIKHQPYDVMQCCKAIMTCSGTATLEIALLGIPMVICYRLNSITYLLGRLLIKTPFIGLPNIIFGQCIIKEFIQDDVTPKNLSNEIYRLLSDDNAAQQLCANLAIVKKKLGDGGGITQMANLVIEMLGQSQITPLPPTFNL